MDPGGFDALMFHPAPSVPERIAENKNIDIPVLTRSGRCPPSAFAVLCPPSLSSIRPHWVHPPSLSSNLPRCPPTSLAVLPHYVHPPLPSSITMSILPRRPPSLCPSSLAVLHPPSPSSVLRHFCFSPRLDVNVD